MPENNKKESEVNMNARDKARKVANELKKDKEKKEKKAMAEVKNSLMQLRQNPELARMYKDNAEVGAKNLVGELPLLKVHAAGRSSKNELVDGSEPNDGWFFYRPTREQFESVECHILTISRGFRAEGMEGKRDVFNQVMAGVIVNNGDIKPFITYLTGLKLSPMWEFGKEVSKYTRAKPIPVPMFALKVKLTTEKVKHSYGKSWVIKFEILKNEDGSPMVVTDLGLFKYLLSHVEIVEDTIASLISAKSTEEKVEAAEEIPHPAEEVNKEKVSPDDIPY